MRTTLNIDNRLLEQAMELTGLTEKTAVVHAGLKSEGIIPAQEFKDSHGQLSVKVGDQVEVVVESVEDGSGETRLSRGSVRPSPSC